MTKATKSQIPSCWAMASLDEVGTWKGGGTPSKSNRQFWSNGTVPWVSPKDMKTFEIAETEDLISEAAVQSSATTLLPAGSVLIVTRSGILRHSLPVAVTRVPVTINQDLKALTPESGMESRYIGYALRASAQTILHDCVKDGTTVQSVEFEQLKRFHIPIAPSGEQTRIADALDELLSDLDAGVEALERAKAKLKLYRASVVKAAVTGDLTADWRGTHRKAEPASALLERILKERRCIWEEMQLAKFQSSGKTPPPNWKAKYKEPGTLQTKQLPILPAGWCWASTEQLCDFITKGTTPSGGDAPTPAGDVPFIKVQHLSSKGEFHFHETPAYVRMPVHRGFLNRSRIFPGDVLMNIVGPPLGQVSIVPSDFPEWNMNQAIAVFRTIAGVMNRYLAICLSTNAILAPALKKAKATAGQINLTLEICREIAIPLPSLEEQAAIVDEIELQLSGIDHLDKEALRSSAHGSAMRQSMLRSAFMGLLVEQSVEDEPAHALLDRIAAERKERQAIRTRKPKNQSTPRKRTK